MNDVKVILFLRVSTVKQKTDSGQLQELQKKAKVMNWEVIATIEEKISGKNKLEDRPGIQKLLALLATYQAGQKPRVLVYDVSRIGRNLKEGATLIQQLTEMGVSVFINDLGQETLTNGKQNGIVLLITNLMLSIAEYQRVQSNEKAYIGQQVAKSRGVHLGRKRDTPEQAEKRKADFLKKHKRIVTTLEKDPTRGVRSLARDFKTSPSTVTKIKELMGLK